MALNIIVSGLSEEEVSYVRDASSLFWGDGVVDIKEYQLSDINLVKDLRLQIKDSSLVGVFLAEFSKIPSLEATRSILTSESKFFEVQNTKSLVDYLNSTFGTSFTYAEEVQVTSVEGGVVGTPSFDEEYYKRQLEAKDGTIRNLEAQLKAQRLSAIQDDVLADGVDWGIEIETDPVEAIVVEETPEYIALKETSDKVNSENERLSLEVERLRSDLTTANEKASNQAGLARSKDELIADLRQQLADKTTGISEEELEIRLRDCRLEVTNNLNSEKFQLENSLRTQLNNKDLDITKLQQEVEDIRKAKIDAAIDFESKLGSKDQEIAQLKQEVEQSKFKEHTEYEYKEQLSHLREDLEKEKKNVVELNRKLIQGNYSEVEGVYPEDWAVQPVSSFFEVVTGDLFAGLVSLKNVEFVFSGSGDSLREGYLFAESLLTRAGGGVILDLSTESTLDYRFGIRKGHEMSNWLSDEPSSIKKYLSKTKHKNIFALGTFKGTFNDLYLAGVNLVPYLQYLDSLGTKVVIFGGTTSSFMGRKLCSSAVQVSHVSVVCRSLGTSARTMLFNSKAMFGSSKANYYLSGKLDDMSKIVLNKAKREGFDWRLLDA